MGLGDKIKSVFKKVEKNVQYECESCDYEAAKKRFETESGRLECPRCGSNHVEID